MHSFRRTVPPKRQLDYDTSDTTILEVADGCSLFDRTNAKMQEWDHLMSKSRSLFRRRNPARKMDANGKDFRDLAVGPVVERFGVRITRCIPDGCDYLAVTITYRSTAHARA